MNLQIDEEGFILSQGVRWTDATSAGEVFRNLKRNEFKSYVSELQAQLIFVEPFDHPLVAKEISVSDSKIRIPYELDFRIDLAAFDLDEWDRITGLTTEGHRFVLSRAAQMGFFDQVDSFDDEGFVWNNSRFEFGAWPRPGQANLGPAFWDQGYRETAGWDLGGPHPALGATVDQLKLARSRVLVLGCGRGHDAAFLAKKGHIVTAVDSSPEGLNQAKALYRDIPGLQFLLLDGFHLPQAMMGQFDLVFEHTLYCAIDPKRRNDLVSVWRRVLHDQGQLLAILPLFDRNEGPPFASTEWEIQQRLKRTFRFLYWTRSALAPPQRKGQELLLFAQRLLS